MAGKKLPSGCIHYFNTCVGGSPVRVILKFREPGQREPPCGAEDSKSGNPQTGGKPLPGITGPVRNRSGRKSIRQESGVRMKECMRDVTLCNIR